jgi:intracellular sulfur oxidation DsrE/DsrF family protein
MKTVFHVFSPDAGDQQHTMINAANLLAGVERVPSGLGDLARLEDEGFGYVKAP